MEIYSIEHSTDDGLTTSNSKTDIKFTVSSVAGYLILIALAVPIAMLYIIAIKRLWALLW